MVKCPHCAGEGAFKELKEWKFRFYAVKRLQCLKCKGIFNFYSGIHQHENSFAYQITF
jgi:hypothetical protein